MSRPFEGHLADWPAYLRKVQFAVEVLDAVTLERVSAGLTVVADGLRGKPIVNIGGLFVWLEGNPGTLKKITVDPGALPYERVELAAADVKPPPAWATIALPPRDDYGFAAGITGLRGTLIEDASAQPRVPVRDAEVYLRWLDEDGVTWREAPTLSRTNSAGDFVAIVRLAPTEVPLLTDRALTVRLRARREGTAWHGSANLTLPQGRVADPSTFAQDPAALTFAWDELQP